MNKTTKYAIGVSAFIVIFAGLMARSPRKSVSIDQPLELNLAEKLAIGSEESPRAYYSKWLADYQNRVWDQFAQQGINKDDIERAVNDYYSKVYTAKEDHIKATHAGLSSDSPYQALVSDIIKEFGIGKSMSIVCLPEDGFTAAATTDSIVLLNPVVLDALPKLAQKFVIGHEMIHVMHRDDLIFEVLTDYLKQQKIDEKIAMELMNSFSEFIEFRADILSALHSKEYVEGKIAYLKIGLDLIGNHKEPGYPTIAERLAHATKIKAGEILV